MTIYDQLAEMPTKERDALLSSLGYAKKRTSTRGVSTFKSLEPKPRKLSDVARSQATRDWATGVQLWIDLSPRERRFRLSHAEAEVLRRRGQNRAAQRVLDNA